MKKIILVVAILVLGLSAGGIKLLSPHSIDPVYQLPLKKYKNFICEASLKDGKIMQFVSVKAMLQVYYHQDYFMHYKYMKSKIKSMFVQDYLTGEKLDAKKALYVFGSRLVGPHGDDLIPLKDRASVKLFNMKFGGTKTMNFTKISAGLIKYLDQ